MFNLLKSALFATVCCMAVGTTTQAQSFTSPFNYNLTSDETTHTNDVNPLSFDDSTGTLTINGTDADDYYIVDMPYYSIISIVQVGQVKKTLDTYYWYELKSIVFNGRAGNDTFEFTDEAMTRMTYLENNYSSYFSLTCDLRGGAGLDVLSGGVGCDILTGGDDGLEDILTGGPGADLFIEHADVQYVPFYSWATRKWILTETYTNQEYEMILDYSPKYESDMRIFKNNLDEIFNTTSETMFLAEEETTESDANSESSSTSSSGDKTLDNNTLTNTVNRK